MPEQLPLPLAPIRREYKPLKPPTCPACDQSIEYDLARIVVWQSFRDWLVLNWNWTAQSLLRDLSYDPGSLSLAAHPDLLWALRAEAGAEGLEVDDCLAQILDSYFQGLFNTIKRRAKKLRLPAKAVTLAPQPEPVPTPKPPPPLQAVCKFCTAPMRQESIKCWRCERDPWHSLHVDRILPPGFQGIWLTHSRRDYRAGPGPLPDWVLLYA